MKVLCAMLYFKLPDNFSGTESDALRLLADYYEKRQKEEKVVISDKLITNPDDFSILKIWKRFIEIIPNGYKMHGDLTISDVDMKD